MKILNKTKNKILAKKVLKANTFLKKLKGLLFKKNIDKDFGLILYSATSIHSFFMKFSFDALFLDKNKRVIYLKTFKPNKISPVILKTKYIIELSSGKIKETNTALGDDIEFI